MVCHKKCESRRQVAGPCPAITISNTTSSFNDDKDDNIDIISFGNEVGPEIFLTGCEENLQVQNEMCNKSIHK